jgi:quinol monooxygenase YgiN
MIVEYIRYKVEASRVNELVAAYEKGSESLRSSSHCLGYELTRCAEEPECYTMRILWDSSEGHLKGFRTSEEFRPFLAAVRPFVPNILEMRHYEMTPLRWQR